MMREFLCIFVVAMGSCVSGCYAPNAAVTEFGMNPVTKSFNFRDTKDNDVYVKDFKAGYDKDGHRTVSFAELKIQNNASNVNRSYAEMMAVWQTQMATANEGIKAIAGPLAAVATAYAPYIGPALGAKISTPPAATSPTGPPPNPFITPAPNGGATITGSITK